MNKGNFNKGHTPWNSGLKGIHLSPETEFKKGYITGDKHPSWKGGIQTPQDDCAYLYNGVNKRVRRPKKVYEDAYGSIPKGWILFHLDRNKHNDDLDNLIAIPRAILMSINSNRMNSNYHTIKQALKHYEK